MQAKQCLSLFGKACEMYDGGYSYGIILVLKVATGVIPTGLLGIACRAWAGQLANWHRDEHRQIDPVSIDLARYDVSLPCIRGTASVLNSLLPPLSSRDSRRAQP
jgi:hypothetical protein